MPRTLGSMMLRPGFGLIGDTYNNLVAKYLDFVFATDDTALIELSDNLMRVWVNDSVITRTSVTTTITNGTFDTNLTGWTDADEAGAVSDWGTGGYMTLTGTGFNAAIRYQLVTADPNKETGLRIVIVRGPVLIRIGSTVGGDDYVTERSIGTGTHSWIFTPTGNFYIQFASRTVYQVLVDSVAIEGGGFMTLPTPWEDTDLPQIRKDQSGDVVYIACKDVQQYKIQRYGTKSWSIVKYEPLDGPFRALNVTKIKITASAISGDVTLTASAPLFRSDQVGALFQITSNGQSTENTIAGDDQWTDPIRVTGLDANHGRDLYLTITGVWVGTITLQRSVGEIGSWLDTPINFTTNQGPAHEVDADNDDNQIYYYRFGFKTGQYTSGSALVDVAYASGSISGTVRINTFSTSGSVSASVLKTLGGTNGTDNWSEGEWSDYRGWPSAVAIYESRVWWAGKDKVWGSISDAFESFDDSLAGDAGTIARSIGAGPVDTVSWLMPVQRLLLGGQGAEHSIRSSSFDEPLTPTNFNIKQASTQGSANVAAVRYDSSGAFVQRGGARVFELSFGQANSSDGYTYDYGSGDLSILCPEILLPSVVALGVQRQPDTRIHCVRSDGKVAVLVYDKAENVRCWVLVEMDDSADLIKDVVVLPGNVEDQVYYLILAKNGNYYLTKWAQESECHGGQMCKIADLYVTNTLTPTTALFGLGHLVGREVVVWADGVYLPGPFTVSGGGTISLGASYTNVCAGLPYTAQYKSTKLAYGAGLGTALNQRKRVGNISLVLRDTHKAGLKYGPDFTNLDDLPNVEDGATTPANYVWESFDKDSFAFNGTWDTDSRICLQASAPRPATVCGLVVTLVTNDKS